MSRSHHEYLGDGVYASFDGLHVVLEAENELGPNRIYLDSSVLHALIVYQTRLCEALARERARSPEALPDGEAPPDSPTVSGSEEEG